jgi:hypothetical protein
VANGNGLSNRWVWGIVAGVLGSLTIAALTGSIQLWEQFTRLQERYDMTAKVTTYQTKLIEQNMAALAKIEHVTLLLEERQQKMAVLEDVLGKQMTTMHAANTEQQYQINLLLERLRLLERREAAEEKR